MTAVEPARTDVGSVTITINDQVVAARAGEPIIAAADRTDHFIPRFCYHPRMSSVGMCRQCLVEVDTPRGPQMVVSCMTPVAEGQVVRTATEAVRTAQEGILELLLANHPLDCPVCDKGGECPLQDQAFSHGPGESRHVEEKRHYEKPIPISDLVLLDRERCILCDRCTRFADEVAGDPLISFTSRGNDTQVLTFPDHPFASYFSGNTVQICPVGALTATPYRFKARPWDLSQVESTCTTCSVGCRVVVQSSRDEVVRVQGVDSDPVNWGWLCDRGRFDFQSITAGARVTAPLVRGESGELEPASWSEAIERASRLLRTAVASSPRSVAILGGARGTNEDAFAWAAFADALGVVDRDAQMGDGLPASVFSLPAATIDDVCAASTVVLLAPDLKEELPVLFLRLRDAAIRRPDLVVEISSTQTAITPLSWRSVRLEPGMAATAIAAGELGADVDARLREGDVVVVVGRANLAESEGSTMDALAAILERSPGARVLPVLRRGNVRGAVAAGLTPVGDGRGTVASLTHAARGGVECLVLLGADPLSDVGDVGLARRGLAGARSIVAIDAFLTASANLAEVVLPACVWGEKIGTTTNVEGRVTEVAAAVTPAGTSRPDWMIAVELAAACGVELGALTVGDVRRAMVERAPSFATVPVDGPLPVDGCLLTSGETVRIERSGIECGERNSYDFRLLASRVLYDRAVATAMSPSLVGQIGESVVAVHSLDLARIGVPEGAPVAVTSRAGAVVVPVAADDRIMRGCARVVLGQDGPDPRELIGSDAPVLDVRIEKP